MPGDHGRVRNTLEQHGYGHQRYSPPVGRQGPREPALGAHYGATGDEWRECDIDDYGTECAVATGHFVPDKTKGADDDDE